MSPLRLLRFADSALHPRTGFCTGAFYRSIYYAAAFRPAALGDCAYKSSCGTRQSAAAGFNPLHRFGDSGANPDRITARRQ